MHIKKGLYFCAEMPNFIVVGHVLGMVKKVAVMDLVRVTPPSYTYESTPWREEDFEKAKSFKKITRSQFECIKGVVLPNG